MSAQRCKGLSPRFILFIQFGGNHPQEELSQNLRILLYFGDLLENYCLNMALSFRIFSFKIWGTLADLVTSHTWICFCCQVAKIRQKLKKAVNIESQEE
jgi:hypothetical protein